MAKDNTFEVSILAGGTLLTTKDKNKAEALFNELAPAMYPDKVYLQTWNGYKLVSERIANKEQRNER